MGQRAGAMTHNTCVYSEVCSTVTLSTRKGRLTCSGSVKGLRRNLLKVPSVHKPCLCESVARRLNRETKSLIISVTLTQAIKKMATVIVLEGLMLIRLLWSTRRGPKSMTLRSMPQSCSRLIHLDLGHRILSRRMWRRLTILARP